MAGRPGAVRFSSNRHSSDFVRRRAINSGPISFTLDNLSPADLFREWTITEANAASIGLDWSEIVDASLHAWPGSPPIHPITGEYLWYTPTSTIDTPMGSFPRSVCCIFGFNPLRDELRQTGVMLESLRLRVMNFNYHPGEAVVYFAVGTWLNGTAAQEIPEPSTAAIGLLAIVGAFVHRRRAIG